MGETLERVEMGFEIDPGNEDIRTFGRGRKHVAVVYMGLYPKLFQHSLHRHLTHKAAAAAVAAYHQNIQHPVHLLFLFCHVSCHILFFAVKRVRIFKQKCKKQIKYDIYCL